MMYACANEWEYVYNSVTNIWPSSEQDMQPRKRPKKQQPYFEHESVSGRKKIKF
jgi:hypothetical protein